MELSKNTVKVIKLISRNGWVSSSDMPLEETITLEEIKKIRLDELEKQYNKDIEGDFISEATGEPISFGYSEKNQLDYSKIATTLSLDSSKQYLTIGSNDGIINMTKEQFLKFIRDCENRELNMYVKMKEYQYHINIAKTVEEVKSIEFIF